MPPLVQSNDSYCEDITYSLKTSTGDPATATGPTAAELTNFFIDVGSPNDLSYFPQDEGSYSFWILAKTVTDKYIYKPVTLNVICDANSQTVSLATADTLIVEVLKNEGTRTLISTADV